MPAGCRVANCIKQKEKSMCPGHGRYGLNAVCASTSLSADVKWFQCEGTGASFSSLLKIGLSPVLNGCATGNGGDCLCARRVSEIAGTECDLGHDLLKLCWHPCRHPAHASVAVYVWGLVWVEE